MSLHDLEEDRVSVAVPETRFRVPTRATPRRAFYEPVSFDGLLKHLSPTRVRSIYRTPFIKAALDRVGAAGALLAFAPLFAYLAWQVKKDGGPAFYGQVRVGRDGKSFKCWKFRTMIVNAEQVLQKILAEDPEAKAEWDRDFKLKNDPRVTKVGAFLRKTSLDELPQLWNVLKGEMSLVGPRPITDKEKIFYGTKIKDYLAVNPGMTGLWQVSGRNDVTYAERVSLDSHYVHNWSLMRDIRIMFQTVGVMLHRKGAY